MIRTSLVGLLVIAGTAYGQGPVSLSPVKDNTLYESTTGSLSNGAGEHMFAGNTMTNSTRRAVLAFDIAGTIPAGATIDSVVLTLYFSRTAGSPEDVELRRILADWGEGTSDANGDEGGGAPATTGDATWLHTFFSTGFWSTPGGDFSSVSSATQTIGDFFQYGHYTWGSTPEMVADVQDWLDNPLNNYGWILLGNETTSGTSKRFDTKENSTEENRPVLTVYYSDELCEDFSSGRLASKCQANGTINLRFTLLNNVVWDGTEVCFSIDGGEEFCGILEGQTPPGHSRVSLQIAGGFEPGDHTVTMTQPDCGLSWIVNCRVPGEGEDGTWETELVGLPDKTELIGNYPNPFNPTTTIRYALSADTHVTLRIYNTLGQEVATLVDGVQAAGYKEARWEARNAASGIYLYRLTTGDVVQTGRMNLLK